MLFDHNVTTNCVRVTFHAVESGYALNRVSVCLCSCFSNPASSTHAAYYFVVCDLAGSNIFFNALFDRRHDFLRKKFNLKCVSRFATTYV